MTTRLPSASAGLGLRRALLDGLREAPAGTFDFLECAPDNWIGKAAGFFGGVLGGAGSAVEGLAQAGWGEARDTAFKDAVEQAKRHFHRCAKCSGYFCDRCWNAGKGLCLNCAPDVESANRMHRDAAVRHRPARRKR